VVENRSDDQYWEQDIPSNFWLQGRSCVALLAVLVHRDSADIRPNPADASPGESRNQVRAEARARNQEERQQPGLHLSKIKIFNSRGPSWQPPKAWSSSNKMML